MPWTLDDYPSAMKNLNDVTKKKATDIANAMVDEGYDEDRAIPIAIEQAKEWHANADQEDIEHYRKYGKPTLRSKEGKRQQNNPERLNEREEVVPHQDGWAVQSSGGIQPSHVYDKKQTAIDRAKEIANNKGTSVKVFNKSESK